MTETKHVLLIEDHKRLAEFIRKGLENSEFSVHYCDKGEDGLLAIETGNFDAAILDLGLPDMDGIEVLREIRRSGNQTPILILTARIGVTDRVDGLNTGADDYLTKPFDMNELVARINALLRRPSQVIESVLKVGNLSLMPGGREVDVGSIPIELSRRESLLLEQLMRSQGKVLPKSKLEKTLYGGREEVSSNSLEVLVHRLRKKLDDAGSQTIISTVRGVGYMIMNSA